MAFALAWWLVVDAAVLAGKLDDEPVYFQYFVPGMIGTLGMFMMQMVTPGSLNADSFNYSGTNVAGKARMWLLISFLLLFGGLIGGFWILFANYVSKGDEVISQWPGAAIVLSNFLVFVSALVFFFGRGEDDDGMM